MSDETLASLIPAQFSDTLAKLVIHIERKRKDTARAFIGTIREFITDVRDHSLEGDFLDHDLKSVEGSLANLEQYCEGDGISDVNALIFAEHVDLKLLYIFDKYPELFMTDRLQERK